ncbi:MAG: hypothetical protein ABSA81_06145 [Candidatus Bathyarchaeia archaeon]
MVVYAYASKDKDLVDAFYAAAVQLGTDAILSIVTTRKFLQEPSRMAIELMKQADIVIDLPTVPWMYTNGLEEILDSGVRMLNVVASAESVAKLPPTDEIIQRSKMGAALFEKANSVHVVSEAGTNITMGCQGRPGLGQDGVAREPGEWDNATTAIIAVAPIEDQADGTIVVNRGDTIYMHPHRRICETPVRIAVRKGKIVSITGGTEAMLMQQWLSSFNDPNSYVIGHTGFGGDPRAEVASMEFTEWESLAGGVNVAFGSNMFRLLKGQNTAKSHMDIVLMNATMHLDDQLVIEEGKFAHPDLKS